MMAILLLSHTCCSSLFQPTSISGAFTQERQHFITRRPSLCTLCYYSDGATPWIAHVQHQLRCCTARYEVNRKPNSSMVAEATIASSSSGVPPLPKYEPDISPHRAVVVVRLLRIEQGGAYSDVLSGLGNETCREEMQYVERTLGFRTRGLQSQDIKLVTDEVAGITRWKRYLDFLIFSVYKQDSREYDHLEPLLRQILRLGVYELVKLEMPPHAVLNENVKLAKLSLRAGAGNMVNAMLRSLIHLQINGTMPFPAEGDSKRSRARTLATIHSHPVWLVRRWVARYGEEEAIKLMEWNNLRPRFSLRANYAQGVSRADLASHLEQLKVAHTLSPYLHEFIRLSTGMQDVVQAKLIQRGICAVQDESAGLIVALMDPQPCDLIVDCCAAPGAKALFIASRLKGKGHVTAVDVNNSRLRMLKEAAYQQGVASVVSIHHTDIRDYARKVENVVDRVLLDAPCSGLGVLSKRADIRWRRTAADLETLAELQNELLTAAAKIVRPGGVLIYSTCSIEPEENSDRVREFLRQHQEFYVESANNFLPEHMVTEDGFFASLPHRDQFDGAFAVRLIRSSVVK
ncbi:hypothetical protein O6H91_05G050300 [Diphasiastrum complanatum]|uniref:Uncharacterized protein n=2 Tax=Diphasiastrum complanatum TaxID=34168 RepID=A0ACC2DN53_DIPCM|nr:hypothetical protein O6H91_Y084400 [Diphasiastrum complanatum]KAJ7555679.1 hypothetical protein O6H91_05G050300 [Diphasiastrum complanatum]KAJ7555680.1 hypothetical protein O6H91_05G050300 [Diphasiastrum complanatum]